jgi:uncharacterized metal-binding protein YceD (DUF177 family)
MARMTKKEVLAEQESFLVNKKGDYKYTPKCIRCAKDCKQSFRVTIEYCPHYRRAAK